MNLEILVKMTNIKIFKKTIKKKEKNNKKLYELYISNMSLI